MKKYAFSYLVSLTLFAGMAHNHQSNNQALLVSVSHGLPGLDFDIGYLTNILRDSTNQFQINLSKDSDSTTVTNEIIRSAEAVGNQGTFTFYFTGHGSVGGILMEDRIVTIQELRAAIEKAREKRGPLTRLVLVFDSCHSGSLIDPVRSHDEAQLFVDSLVKEFSIKRGRNYWDELFIFASAGAEEVCFAGENGSEFTVALSQAWTKTIGLDGSLADFISETKKGTLGSHPIERLVPASLGNEKLNR